MSPAYYSELIKIAKEHEDSVAFYTSQSSGPGVCSNYCNFAAYRIGLYCLLTIGVRILLTPP